ncbi:MAG TPA: hypothetical protein VMJ32_13240 [Pirellulales bacterium]|nr:hypothetical protein [Pirellulales bacterium]
MSILAALRDISRSCIAAGACLLGSTLALADPPLVHHLNAGVLVPGEIGAAKLQQGGPLAGYYQPLEIRGPQGTNISFAVENQFTQPQPAPTKVAMLIGPVYRLRVTGIPHHEGDEVYPTIEVINRLYPPCGEELRFPIPIEFTQEDLEAAIDGKFITRIIYLENPRNAYARQEDPKSQLTLEASPKEDPLALADRLGRPMAIVRIGGRVPVDVASPDEQFMYNSPPLIRFAKRDGAPPPETMLGQMPTQ